MFRFFSTCYTSTCCFVKLRLLLALLFFVHGFSGPFPGCLLMGFSGPNPCLCLFLHGHLARVSTSLQFTTLGLNACVVHDHCERRCCGHRRSNLLKILDVKGSHYVTMCILPSSTNCTSSHGLPNSPAQRLAKQSVSSGLPSSPAQARHSHLNIHVRGRPKGLEFAVYRLSLAFSDFVPGFRTSVPTSPPKSRQSRF